ncbi:hypothetical protein [Streptomyces sp. NPDC088350]|uniref:hypothetical protein n=1 Tax=Streptomyces sp. NPDC088350 TaxID=3365854 RepID=UPI003823A4B7
MAQRPTASWRERVAGEAERIAAGTLDPDRAWATGLFPEELSAETDAVLAVFEAELADVTAVTVVGTPDDARILGAVERVVLALNAVNLARDQRAYETGEREELCDYIDESLTEHGLDVAELTARNGLGRYELTDRWRIW